MDVEIRAPEGEIVLFARNIGDVKIILKANSSSKRFDLKSEIISKTIH
jgi:hypothetical protein